MSIYCSERPVDTTGQDYTDTVPLLAAQEPVQANGNSAHYLVSQPIKQNKPPVILGLDKLMSSSMYSDKMQVGEGD